MLLPESIAERAWNGGPEKVKVLYAKCEYGGRWSTQVGRDTRNPG